MKKAFTINCMRTNEDFIGYNELLKKGIYQGIEIFYPYNVSDEQTEFYTQSLKTLLCNNKNIEVVLHLPHGSQNSLLGENNEQVYQLMIDAIEYANKFNVKKLTLHLGMVNVKISRDKNIDKIIPILQKMCDYCLQYKMYIMIENMPSLAELGVSPKEILGIIRKVNRDNLKFILDTGHAFVSGYPLHEYVFELKKYLFHIHFNDNNGFKDEHKRMGLGKINFNELFQNLYEIGYNQLHCMEVIFKDYYELEFFAQDLEKFNRKNGPLN